MPSLNPKLRNPSPALPCLALTINWALGCALTCNSSLCLSYLIIIYSSQPFTQTTVFQSNYLEFTETDALCYPTTSVVSSHSTIFIVWWSEVTSLHNPSPDLPCPALPSPCLYIPISLPIQLGSLWNLKLKLLCYKPIIPTCLFAIWGD